ncbi:peptidase [Streptomyces sp. ODS28]|uniref:trypsin-like serine peptidase n=1 Tax=Streptomyces sp. ODS28 TaxID=3136688 RepID=UPI0031F06CE9
MRSSNRTARRAAGAVISALSVASLAAVGPLASPAAASGAQTGDSTTQSSPSADQRGNAADFWTAERMRSAKPLDLAELGRKAGDTVRKAVPGGDSLEIPPVGGGSGTKSFPQKGGPWTGGGEVTKTTGRIFFTYQGRQASCSGDAVTSGNKSTVVTAGHCVKLEGKWHTNWTFVPGYHDGQAPYGKWSASKTLTTPQWEKSEDINYDVGAAVVSPLDGKKLTDVVGGQGLSFNSGYRQDMYAFGYPAASPYDGSKLIYCSGRTFKDFLQSKDHGMSCNMTGGSSGGPWFTKFDEKTGKGLQSSVNSFGYTFLPNVMFGPYFGEDAKALYEKASAS